MTPAERAKIVMLEARSGPLLDCHPDRTERLIAAAIEERQAEVDRLTAENADLRAELDDQLQWEEHKTDTINQLRELAGELLMLLDLDDNCADHFATRAECDAWLAKANAALAEAERVCRAEEIAHAEVGSAGSAIGCQDCADAIADLAEVDRG